MIGPEARELWVSPKQWPRKNEAQIAAACHHYIGCPPPEQARGMQDGRPTARRDTFVLPSQLLSSDDDVISGGSREGSTLLHRPHDIWICAGEAHPAS